MSDKYSDTFEQVEKLTTIDKIRHLASGLRMLVKDIEFLDNEETAPRTDQQSNAIFSAVQTLARDSDVESWFCSYGPGMMFDLATFRQSVDLWTIKPKRIADMDSDVLAFADWLDMLVDSKTSIVAALSPDDWVEVPFKKQRVAQMFVARSTCYEHGKDPKLKEIIQFMGDGMFIIRRRYLSRYVKESLLKTYLERPAFTKP